MALTINVNNAPVFKYSIDAFSFNLDDGIVFDASSALSFTGSENASFKFSYIYPNDAEDTSVQLETSGTDTNSWSYNGLEAGPIEPEYVFASSFSDENIVYNGFALAFNEAVETVFPDRIAFSFDEYNMTIETQSDFDNFVNFAASTDELPIQSLEQGVSHLFSELHNIDVTHPITVSGQLTVGSVLNATVADWIDPDGTSTSTFDYQWLRNGNAVSNANNTAYELTDNDLGSTISVSVRYIDDGGTTEEITSFTSEAVGTALIRDEHSNNAGWKFYTGTDGSDLVFGQSSSVYSSGAGDDTFVSGDDAEFQAFVGGLGTDQYIITKPGVMAVAEVNDGSTNVLSASGIGFTYDTTFVLTVNDGQHLIVEDTLSDQAVWLIDWDEGGFSSSKAILADGEYTAQFIAENLSLRPNYLGDFSWSELIEMGVYIPNDMPELIADAKQWALGADTSNAETVTINLNDNDGTLTAAELETWVGLTGTAPAGSELTLISTWDVTGGSEEILVTTDANGTWEITPEDVEDTPYDGTYALSLTARDASGTVLGTQTSEVTFASGNLAPTETVTINLNDNDGTLTAAELETWVGLTGTAPAGSELTLISTWDVTGGSEEILVTTDANGTWEITPEDVEDTPYDGTYALSLTARDSSGTVLGTQTSEVTFASGNLAPTETVTINLNDNDGTLTAAELETWVGLTGTAPAGSELTLISTWDVTGGSEEILVTTDANGTWEITPEDVEDTPYDGTYALSLTARDSSGTVLGTQTSEVTFASGNLAPTETVTINLNDNDGTLTAAELETWVGLTGTAPAGSELTLISTWDVTGGSEEILVTTDANGTWEITPEDVEDTPYDGTYALSLTARDSSGTVLGTQTSEVTFASGNLAPTETVTINLNDNDGTLTAAELETWVGLTGTAPAGSELTLISTWDVTGGSEEILVTTDANGTWEITPEDVEDTPYDGTYALSLTARDSSGTVLGTQTSEVTFASGNLAPIMGDDGDNILTGTDGNDTLDGGSGNDTLSGGAGDDVYEYWGYEGFDVISETSGFDTIVFKEAHNENAGWGSPFQEGDDLVYVADNGISGFRVTDHFSDPDKSIELFEYELSGYSVLVRNSDQEIVDPFGNYDELLVGTVGNDTIIGAAGDNIIHDEIYGYGGDDTIDNSVGGKSWIEAGDGDDVITGGASEDHIRGQDGDDTLSGNDGNDYLFGGAGDDRLTGGRGNDMVLGGAGNDTLTGGSGSDTFQFHGFFEHDTITDYNSDEDILEFYANDGSALNISDLIETVNSDGNRVLSTADGLSSVTLEGSAGITPSSGGLAMSVVSQDGDVVTFGIFADPITDPDEDGIGSFDFTLNHDALDMQIDAGSLVFATGLSGLQNYDADSGTLTAGAFTLNNVEDLDAPLLTFEATMLDTKAPISIQITDIVVDGDDFASTTEVFDFSALAITTTITDRFGNAMTSAEAQAYEDSVNEITATSTTGNVTVFETASGSDLLIDAAMAIDTASDKAIGAFDALQALRLAVGLDKSDGTSEWHDYIAADINKDGRVGADDALNILKFAVGLTDGPSADWVFVDGDADYSAIDRKNTNYDEGILISDVMTDLSINMTGILVGDVDGSYIA